MRKHTITDISETELELLNSLLSLKLLMCKDKVDKLISCWASVKPRSLNDLIGGMQQKASDVTGVELRARIVDA